MIRIVDLHMYYYDKCILKSVNINIEEGEITALSGDSGSGKTTLLNCISGFIRDYTGKIIIDEKEIEKNQYKMVHDVYNRFFSYVMQDISLINTISIEDNCSLTSASRRHIDDSAFKKRLNQYFDLFEINSIRRKFPFELSGGEKRRAEIAKALALETKYTILDEPTSCLDKYNRGLVIEAIKRSRSNIIIASHDKELLEISDKTYYVNNK